MWWRYLTGLMIAGVVVAVFVMPPPQTVIGDASRIFFFHVPAALCGFVAFVVSGVYGVVYLKNRHPAADRKAAVSAQIGLVFTLIATISGAIFSEVAWGKYWNWDPRQTSVFVVLLIYAAYFALRQAVPARDTRARLSAVYLLLAGLVAPFLFFVLPRLYPSLHPKDSLVSSGGQFTMNLPVGLTFATAMISYLLLYLWLFKLADKIGRIKDELDKQGENAS